MRIEVKRYADAAWAPRFPEARWAWRVTGLNGWCVTGAVRGTKREAVERAEKTAARMACLQSEGMPESSARLRGRGLAAIRSRTHA